MRKIKQLVLASCIASSAMVYSQAVLPTNYDFNNFTSLANLPAGWTSNISGTFTYGTGVTGTAGKFDNTPAPNIEYIQIQSNDPIGLTTYYLKGYGVSSTNPWQGVFKVQESPTGSTWSDMAVYNGNLNPGAYVQYSVTPQNTSHYIRFIFDTKVSGFNVGIDNVNLSAAVITAQEIDIKQSASTILSGGSTSYFNSAVGTPTTINMEIDNIGTVNTLNLSSAVLSGPAAADYTVNMPSFPSTVAPSSSVALNVTFNPGAAGNRDAVLTINNDDSDEGAYVINLKGIGGNFASQPAALPTAFTTSLNKSYRLNIGYTPAATAPDGYIVLRKIGSSSITDLPADGTVYSAGQWIGSSKVIYVGTQTSVGVSNVVAATNYQFAVYPYNGAGAFTNYASSALTSAVMSSGSMMPANEYNGITPGSSTFLTDLSAHTNPHTPIYYGNYDETMVRLFASRDTSGGQKVVDCVYSGEHYVYTEPFAWGYFSREHTYAHNWMPTNPADGTGAAPNNVERPEYDDQHHLFPTNQNSANAPRSNNPFGVVVTLQTTYLGCKIGLDANGNKVFEPRDAHKGDAARALMYMAVCYNGVNDAYGVPQNWKFRNPISSSIPYGQDQNVLKLWNYMDPPSDWEIARNDFLDSLQGNRNPFVDHPEWACYIDFSSMTLLAGSAMPCNTVGIKELDNLGYGLNMYPNPASGEVNFSLLSDEAVKSVTITDVLGRTVYSSKEDVKVISTRHFDNGVYNVIVVSDHKKYQGKLIVQQ